MDFMTGSFRLSILVFLFSSLRYYFCFFLVPCGRLSWLRISFSAHVNTVYHMIVFLFRFTIMLNLTVDTDMTLLHSVSVTVVSGRQRHDGVRLMRCYNSMTYSLGKKPTYNLTTLKFIIVITTPCHATITNKWTIESLTRGDTNNFSNIFRQPR